MTEIKGLQDWTLKEAKWGRLVQVSERADKLQDAVKELQRIINK